MTQDTIANDSLPLTESGVMRFLVSKAVPGIGSVSAAKLVAQFSTEAIKVLRDFPEKTAIPQRIALKASEALKSLKYPAELLAFLSSCGISDMYIERILNKYRTRTAEIISTDPYGMVEDVWQLSFFTADKIGQALGISDTDPRRLRGAIVTAVKHFAEHGNLFALPDQASRYGASIAGVDKELVEAQIASTIASGRIVESRGGLYLPVFYKAEKECAAKILYRSHRNIPEVSIIDIPTHSNAGKEYSPQQREAMAKVLSSSVSVITGGPGTGKTTILGGITEVLRKEGKKIVQAAPTGRAAKRMEALTGMPASTIHRLLGYRKGEGYHGSIIDADVLIIDESSMMEQVLMNHLLEAIPDDTRLILTGDPDQLPAIGAGDVLRDIIASETVPVVNLDINFRQNYNNDIAIGARSIITGKMPVSEPHGNLVILEEEGVKAISDRILSLMAEELPNQRGISPMEIRVVSPQQIGPLGARRLNSLLQERINPEGPALRRGERIFRLHDPVMQTANSSVRGVYNGETGVITAVDVDTQTLEVTFSEGRKSVYSRAELTELVTAYATTVHKLQGSETRYMIFPVTMAHKPMLYRNLLYTGVSRATDLCILVGEKEALQYAVENNPTHNRNSNFRHRLARTGTSKSQTDN